MKIFKKAICLVLVLVATSLAFGQNSKGDRKAHKEKIKAMKVSYITEKLNLTSEEAEKFWPIYNEYDAKMRDIHRAHKSNVRKLKKFDELTEEELATLSEHIFALRTKIING